MGIFLNSKIALKNKDYVDSLNDNFISDMITKKW